MTVPAASHPITLYMGHSLNGTKISITLERLGQPYNVQKKIDTATSKQQSAWFTINPKGHTPALTDTLVDGSEVTVFESGSIMLYLVGRNDPECRINYPRGTEEWIEVGH